MKTNVTYNEPKKFETIKIELTIESIEELKWLWAIAKSSVVYAQSNSITHLLGTLHHTEEVKAIQMTVFNLFDSIAKKVASK